MKSVPFIALLTALGWDAAAAACIADTVYATQTAFSAKLTDGSAVSWGSAMGGGDSSSVSASLTSGVDNLLLLQLRIPHWLRLCRKEDRRKCGDMGDVH